MFKNFIITFVFAIIFAFTSAVSVVPTETAKVTTIGRWGWTITQTIAWGPKTTAPSSDVFWYPTPSVWPPTKGADWTVSRFPWGPPSPVHTQTTESIYFDPSAGYGPFVTKVVNDQAAPSPVSPSSATESVQVVKTTLVTVTTNAAISSSEAV